MILSYSTQTIPAATKVCAHISRAIYEISKAQERSLAHTQGLFMDSVSQTKVQHVPRVMGQAMAWGWHMPVHVPGAGHAGQGWIHLKGFPHRQKGRGLSPGTASTDTAESVYYLGGYFLEAQESAKKF